MTIRYLSTLFLLTALIVLFESSAFGQRCTEELQEGYCFFDPDASFKEAFTFSEGLAATDLRQPPASGYANALVVKEILSKTDNESWVEAAYKKVVLRLRETYSQQDLCDYIILNYASTTVDTTLGGGLEGEFSFHIARDKRCYQANSYPSIVFEFSADGILNSITPPARLPTVDGKGIRPKTIQDLSEEEGLFAKSEVLETIFVSKDTLRLICHSCAKGVNSVLYTNDPLRILSKDFDTSIGLAQLSTNNSAIQAGYVPIEFKILGYHEVLDKGELVPYFSAKTIARQPEDHFVTDTFSFYADWKTINQYGHQGKAEKVGLNYFGIVTPTDNNTESKIARASGFPSIELLRNPVQRSLYSTKGQFDRIYETFNLERVSSSQELKLEPFSWFDASSDSIVVMGGMYTSDSEAIVSDWTVEISYDTSQLGTHIVQNEKLELSHIDQIPDLDLQMRISQLATVKADSLLLNYDLQIEDVDARTFQIRLKLKPGKTPIRLFDNETYSVNPSKSNAFFLLRLDASHLASNKIISFWTQDKKVDAYIQGRKRIPKINSIYSSKNGDEEIVTFVGKNLDEKDIIFWVPCQIADDDVPIVGYCNIQPWHQRGQRLTSDTSSFIMPPSFSHGMSRRTDLVPRCGQVLVKSKYGQEITRGGMIFCEDKRAGQ